MTNSASTADTLLSASYVPTAATEPFLKWAGGKRWAVKQIAELAPSRFIRYIEPFLGGGSAFFYLAPERAILSDINPNLIEVYRQVRDRPAEIERCLSWLQKRHSKELYYAIRSKAFSCPILRTARFIYLNRTCWNGLYRVNRAGQFNVPIGTKTKVEFEVSLETFGAALSRATLVSADFETVLASAQSGDFVFVDPPYTVKHNNNGFVKYNERIFSWSDQERLARSVQSASLRGASVLVSNADHRSIRELFAPLGDVVSLARPSVIAGSSSARGTERELMIRCY